MANDVRIFPEHIGTIEYIDLKEASKRTGLKYSMLYKLIVLEGAVGYCKFGRKIVLPVANVQNLMNEHYIGAKK